MAVGTDGERGRPAVVTSARIAEAGRAITLPHLSIHAVAEELGVSDMTIYRHVGSAEGLRRVVAQSIAADFPLPGRLDPDPVVALTELGASLWSYARAHPGIAEHMLGLGEGDAAIIGLVDEVQSRFAAAFGWPDAAASWIVSAVAEVGLSLANRPVPAPRAGVPDVGSTVAAGIAAADGMDEDDRVRWLLAALARGAIAETSST